MYSRVYAEIDLDAIEWNLNSMRQNVREGTKLCAVIKADGYGHGAVPVARAIEPMVWGYAVATAAEAVSLRHHGIEKPVLILGYTPDSWLETAIEMGIRMTVFCLEDAETLSKLAEKLGKKAVLHIKVDTGMSRIGMPPTMETVEIIRKMAALPGIVIEGIFTHMATADEKEKDRAIRQIERFSFVCRQLQKEGISIPICHCSNSAGIIDLPQANFDLVRCGISLYGMYPSEEVCKERVPLKPALSLKSEVIYVKTIEKGTSIGYGATFTASRPTTVATIPVGYADGYPRALSGKGWVLIHGEKAPILGRICMDQFMVDVTQIPNVKRSDPVTLIGVDGANRISVEEMADLAGSFNYEFVCNLSARVPRVYRYRGQFAGKKDCFADRYEDFCQPLLQKGEEDGKRRV